MIEDESECEEFAKFLQNKKTFFSKIFSLKNQTEVSLKRKWIQRLLLEKLFHSMYASSIKQYLMTPPNAIENKDHENEKNEKIDFEIFRKKISKKKI